MDVKQLQQDYGKLMAQVEAIAAKHPDGLYPAEVQTQINGLLGKTDEITAQIDLEKRMKKARDFAEEPVTNSAVTLNWRKAGQQEGVFAVDGKSWRKLEVETPFGTKQMRYNVPLVTEAKDYADAFSSYMEKRHFIDIGQVDRKTLAEGADGSGGFLIPPDYQTEIIKKQMTLTQIRPNAMVIQTSRDVAQWPKVTYTSNPTDDTTSSKYTSGVRLSWPGETPATSTQHRVTEPVFGLYSIPVHVAMASMPIANSLLEDAAFDVVGISTDLFGEAFALGEEDAFILGGTGTTTAGARPMGILGEIDTNGPGSVASKQVNQTLDAEDVINLFYKVPVQYRRAGKWIINSNSMQAVEKLKDSQGRFIVSSLLQASLATPQFDTLKGKPVLVDEFMPDYTAANNYPLIFGDLSGYMIVDRVGLSVQKLSELYAETDVTLLLARKRVGGYCIRPWMLKVLKMQ
jgi:HK97 family phage major capsid protein